MLSQNIALRHFEKLQKQERQSCLLFVFPLKAGQKPLPLPVQGSLLSSQSWNPEARAIFISEDTGSRKNVSRQVLLHSVPLWQSILPPSPKNTSHPCRLFFTLAVKILKESLALKCVENQLALSLGKMWIQEMTVAS